MVISIIDYSPLWETMKEKSVSQYRLLNSGIDNKTLDSLKKNKNITLLTLEKLCDILSCTPNDIVQFRKTDGFSKDFAVRKCSGEIRRSVFVFNVSFIHIRLRPCCI